MCEQRYMEMGDRRQVIINYARDYNIRCFVETGTADGSTTDALIPHFDELYTVEIDEGMATHARLLFANEPKVHCFMGDSGVWLYDMVKQLQVDNTPAIFWLDGHYCGGPTRGATDSPVIEELGACWDAPVGSVILIDDARIFGGGLEEGLEGYTGYPDMSWVKWAAEEHGLHYHMQDDIIRITPYVQDH